MKKPNPMIFDLELKKRFTKIEPISKGWSEDKKYCVTSTEGIKHLLRISPIERLEERKSLFNMQKQVAALGIPMCTPIELGTCDDGVYYIQSWIDGEDLKPILPLLSEAQQYKLGYISGEILRKMHTISAPKNQEEWEIRFNRKTDIKIKNYHECGLRFNGDEHILLYIQNNRHLLNNRPQCFQHGDYHIGNMMLEKGELKIIDFDRYDFGDPWEDMKSSTWDIQISPVFASGRVDGYFGGEVPLDFWKLLSIYICVGTLSSITWAIPFGECEIGTMKTLAPNVLHWHDNMSRSVPSWYVTKSMVSNHFLNFELPVPMLLNGKLI